MIAQLGVTKGFDVSAFTIDWQARTATCPQGKSSIRWKSARDRTGWDVFNIHFSNNDCHACPVRSACTRAKHEPRSLTVRTQTYHEILQTTRQRQTTEEFKKQYGKRAGVEATFSQGVRAFDLRRSRYIGLAKAHLQYVIDCRGDEHRTGGRLVE